MPALLGDVRVASPAVNLPGPLAADRLAVFAAGGRTTAVNFSQISAAALLIAGRGFAGREALKSVGLGTGDAGLFKVNEAFAGAPLIVQREFGVPGRRPQRQWRLHRHRAPALLNRRGRSPTCPASWSARRRAAACRPSAAPPVPPSCNASREHLS
jgi:hypothetical protein